MMGGDGGTQEAVYAPSTFASPGASNWSGQPEQPLVGGDATCSAATMPPFDPSVAAAPMPPYPDPNTGGAALSDTMGGSNLASVVAETEPGYYMGDPGQSMTQTAADPNAQAQFSGYQQQAPLQAYPHNHIPPAQPPQQAGRMPQEGGEEAGAAVIGSVALAAGAILGLVLIVVSAMTDKTDWLFFLGLAIFIFSSYFCIIPRITRVWGKEKQTSVEDHIRVALSTALILLFLIQAIILGLFLSHYSEYGWYWVVFDIQACCGILLLTRGVPGLRINTNSRAPSGAQIAAGVSLFMYVWVLMCKVWMVVRLPQHDVDGFWSMSTFTVVTGICIPIYMSLNWALRHTKVAARAQSSAATADPSGLSVSGGDWNPWAVVVKLIMIVLSITDGLSLLTQGYPSVNVAPEDDPHGQFSNVKVLVLVAFCLAHAVTVAVDFAPIILHPQLNPNNSTSSVLLALNRHGTFICVDVFFFCIRLMTWSLFSLPPGAFFIKNIISIFILGGYYERSHVLGSKDQREQTLKDANESIFLLRMEIARLHQELSCIARGAALYSPLSLPNGQVPGDQSALLNTMPVQEDMQYAPMTQANGELEATPPAPAGVSAFNYSDPDGPSIQPVEPGPSEGPQIPFQPPPPFQQPQPVPQ